jgi:alpha-mannosidase
LVRYRVLFPVSVTNGKNTQEIPFGALPRPLANEYPAQNWIDYSDGSKGVALLNRGLPGNNVADNTLLLSLMRSTKLLSYPFFGGFEPGVSSDSGLELGKEIGFHYALVPHQGDWTDAMIYRAGLEFNNPLLVQKEEPHAGPLPAQWGLLRVSHPNVVLSALKPGPQDSLILRLYEAAGKTTEKVRIEFTPSLASVYESDLMENQGRELGAQTNALEFSIGPFEIMTFRLKL